MTKRWKLKTTSSNILLVLITLILVKAEWAEGEHKNSWETTNYIGNISDETTHIYVGNDEIAEYFFHPSSNNSSFILEGINKCLDNFQLITCVKMLLLNRINDALDWMKEPGVMQKDVHLLNGLLVFKIKNETLSSGPEEENSELSLDEEIVAKVRRMFYKRSLVVNFLQKYKIEIEPIIGKHLDNLICFSYKEVKQTNARANVEAMSEARKRKVRKRKGGGMSMMMIVPPLIMLGLMPFTLASLKAMVMNAVMMNMMALNGAIFMTIRNLVFGPRKGDNVKYVNYGYSKDKQPQSKRPILIIHSPAAFVKHPPVHKKRVHGHHSDYHPAQNYFPENHNYNSGPSNFYDYQDAQNSDDYEESYYTVQHEDNFYNPHRHKLLERHEPAHKNGI